MLQGIATFNSLDPNGQVQVQTLSSNDTVVILPGVVHSVRLCTQALPVFARKSPDCLQFTSTSGTYLGGTCSTCRVPGH